MIAVNATEAQAGKAIAASLRAYKGDPSGCEACDGFGMCWNNADRTSGQWVSCDACGDERGHP